MVVVVVVTFILIIVSIPSPPNSFIPGLKPSFSASASHIAFFFSFRTDYMDSPNCLLIRLSNPFSTF